MQEDLVEAGAHALASQREDDVFTNPAMRGAHWDTTRDLYRADARAVLAAVASSDEATVEYAQGMFGGDMSVRCNDPEVEDAYPLAKWIPGKQRFGGKVYRRTIRVVKDWAEVPRGDATEEDSDA